MSSYIDIHSHEVEGFKVLVQYQSWRTAVLNQGKENKPESLSYIERHKETDEVFVLLKGKACLVIGGDNEKPDSIEALPMDLNKTYNVKANVWHGVLMSPDASIYIVENIDTSKENSDYYNLTSEEKEKIFSRVSL
jgi:ureidoglycolate hydrolase